MPKASSVLVFLLVFAALSALAQDAPQEKILPRWKWKKGGTFRYRLNGDIVSTGGPAERTLVSSVVTINALNDESASFSNAYTEIKWHEKEVWYAATEEGLKEHSLSFVMNTAGSVKGSDRKLVEEMQEFLDVLMPLPAEPVTVGSFWVVDLEDAGLHGTCKLTGFEKRNQRNCAVFRMELASGERVEKLPARELEATFHFDAEEGCFVHVERRIQRRGEQHKDEKLTVDLISTPSHQTVFEKEQMLIDKLKRRLEKNPDDKSIMRRLSDHYARLGMLVDAISVIDRLFLASPKDPEVMTRKAELLLAAGDAKAALEHFNNALQFEKEFSRALLGAGRAAFQLQEYDGCARYARLALGEDGKSPYQAHYLLGTALAKLGRRKEAVESLERYIELNPNIAKEHKPIIAFTKNNDVSLVVRRATAPVGDLSKRLEYSPEELAEGRELIKVLVKEESVRLRLSQEEVIGLLEYIAEVYGKKPPQMIADFLADRDKTYEKIRTVLGSAGTLPQQKIREMAASEDMDSVTLEALLPMLEPGEALRWLESLFETHADVARYQYLLGRYYMANPAELGRKAVKRFELAAMFDEKNALYHFALALAYFKIPRREEKLLDELAKKNVDVARLQETRVPCARRRLEILEKLGYAKRIRKVTAWTLDDQAEVKVVKELFDVIVGIAQKHHHDGAYAAAATMAELAYYMTLQIEQSASSSLMLVTARSARESVLGTIVEVYARAASDPEEPDRKNYANDLPGWRKRLAEVEEGNLQYLHAYVEFLRRCEKAFQVHPYTDPGKADSFVDKLMTSEVAVFMEEVRKVAEDGEKGKSPQK